MAAPNIINATSIFGKTTAAQLDTTVTTSLLANSASSNKLLNVMFSMVKEGTKAIIDPIKQVPIVIVIG